MENKITPWGKMSYIDYKIKTELSIDDYNVIIIIAIKILHGCILLGYTICKRSS